MAMTIRLTEEEELEIEKIMELRRSATKASAIKFMIATHIQHEEYYVDIEDELKKLKKKHSRLCSELQIVHRSRKNIQSIIEE